MSKQQREKLTATTTPEKSRYDKPSVQVEGELTEEQLEAIAGGDLYMHWPRGSNNRIG